VAGPGGEDRRAAEHLAEAVAQVKVESRSSISAGSNTCRE
jgi:hypothetical protein